MIPKTLDIMIEIIARIVEGYCLFRFFETFGARRMRSRLGTIVLTVLTWVLLTKGASMLAYGAQPASIGERMVSLTLRMTIAFAIGMIVYTCRGMICLFAVLLFTAMTCIWIRVANGVGAIFFYFTDFFARRIDGLNSYVPGIIMAINIFDDAVMIIMPFLSMLYLTRAYRHSLGGLNKKEIASYMMPVITGSGAAVILFYIFILITGNTDFINMAGYDLANIFITLAFAGLWFAIMVSFRLQQDVIGLQEERTQRSVLEGQLKQMQESMAQMECFYENAGRIRHDMKNQMHTLEGLLRDESDDEVVRYFEEMQSALDGLTPKIHTGSAVADAVISSKFHYAAKELPGIELDASELVLKDRAGISPYDIGVILNNGLDNAIEACRRVRNAAKVDTGDSADGNSMDIGRADEYAGQSAEVYITIKSYRRQKMLFIEIENSFAGELNWGDDGLPLSTKSADGPHGIGLKNIRATAQKYAGDIDCMAKDGRFALTVMVKI